MFRPNVKAKIRRRSSTNVYGQSIFLPAAPIMIGIVRLEETTDHTSVRADSTASRGSAMESTILSRILIPSTEKVKKGDVIEFMGFAMSVQSVFPRHSISGQFDHWQVDLTIHQNGA